MFGLYWRIFMIFASWWRLLLLSCANFLSFIYICEAAQREGAGASVYEYVWVFRRCWRCLGISLSLCLFPVLAFYFLWTARRPCYIWPCFRFLRVWARITLRNVMERRWDKRGRLRLMSSLRTLMSYLALKCVWICCTQLRRRAVEDGIFAKNGVLINSIG